MEGKESMNGKENVSRQIKESCLPSITKVFASEALESLPENKPNRAQATRALPDPQFQLRRHKRLGNNETPERLAKLEAS